MGQKSHPNGAKKATSSFNMSQYKKELDQILASVGVTEAKRRLAEDAY